MLADMLPAEPQQASAKEDSTTDDSTGRGPAQEARGSGLQRLTALVHQVYMCTP